MLTCPWMILREVPPALVSTENQLIGRILVVQLCVVVPAEQGEKDLKPIDILVTGEFLSQHINYGFSCSFGRQCPVLVDLTSKMMYS